VGVDRKGRGSRPAQAEESLDELAELAASAGAIVAARVMQSRPSLEAATLIGQGKVVEVAALGESLNAGLVIFDHDLTPTQQRNLEKQLSTKSSTARSSSSISSPGAPARGKDACR
jgi:50S ribosomal subunit-associated GTPase HflX